MRNTIAEWGPVLGLALSPDSTAADRWDLVSGGGMVTAGRGGPITGKGANLLISDDLLKNWQEAYSPTIQEQNWDWWRSTAYTRLEPGATAVVVMSRWHELDLPGRLIAQSESGEERWDRVRLPALAADDGDPLGRAPGEALWPERWPAARLAAIREAIGSRAWAALYSQDPLPAAGNVFRASSFRYWRADGGVYVLEGAPGEEARRVDPDQGLRFGTIDLAVSMRTSADYSAAGAWQIIPGERPTLLLLDAARERLSSPEQLGLIRRLIDRHRLGWFGIEATQYQMALVQWGLREGLPVRPLKADTDKRTRAGPLETFLEAGRVYFPAGHPILSALEHEILGFPAADHDDLVDMCAYAALELARYARPRLRGLDRAGRRETAPEAAILAGYFSS